MSLDSFISKAELTVGEHTYTYFDLKAAEANGLPNITRLPASLKVLLENLLRNEDGVSVTKADIQALANWIDNKGSVEHEIAFRPARVLMQDFTGVPAVVDLAAMRDAMVKLGADPAKINPLNPVDLVIDHSVMVDYFGTADAAKKNVDREYERNMERYNFLRWGSSAFNNFRVVPPGTGICHQVNLEYLAQTVWTSVAGGGDVAYPDTVVGTDSHTTMVNGLSVLGWGVGGIEAEAAMLGQPIPMLIPEVIGFKLTGKLPEGATATDLVLTITQMLRKKGVVGKFVEYFGEGLTTLSLEDQATIANMAPEYGATCGFFPVSQATIDYLTATNREPARVALVEAYAKQQGLWLDPENDPVFTDTLELDLGGVLPSLAGPKRPQDRVLLSDAASEFAKALSGEFNKAGDETRSAAVAGTDYSVKHGDVVIAAITSCTNTSNPSVLIAAGLVARKAKTLGLSVKPWVKTSLAPGSQVVTDYLNAAGLTADLDALGFNLTGYGCTTCIGNSGPLPEAISAAINEADLVACSVLSGNRNFEGRVNPDVRANYLASPPLVVAYALAGSLNVNLSTDALGTGSNGEPVYLKDIWPTNAEIAEIQRANVTHDKFSARYADVFKGDEHWQAISVSGGQTYQWDATSTYVANPPYFEGMTMTPEKVTDIVEARVLGIFGDSITTDHISPAGSIKKTSPAGQWLTDHDVPVSEFNSYGARRGHHEVMMRGTFANIRIRNKITPDIEGGVTKHFPSGDVMAIYDAAMRYKAEGRSMVIFAGKEYGTGSSRDWAAKGTKLQGVRAVIAESFERIHRSNLVGMGVLPLQFKIDGWQKLGLTGEEIVTIRGLETVQPRQELIVELFRASDGKVARFPVRCRIDTPTELEYFKNGGVMPYVLRNLARG
ncbi:aconitate hydratase AcnA [Asticcacaulis excentricus]|uniref:Aconitate hydratase n=1 Tax=Asticcacaulis excentricus (strain ATCC 15261 / DSM 4724 / KCTC 12464 / NCIMB 9791 / VKM B-1370 / CB 48) TaxID=573065 RepID=E8RQF6_ASTEC|nr:aconitate hydratase AcnA [Asticcacaulis excentricus]ADU12140.1 aconitate hydratase 1 [Asticcacaulis excentricus CB 48]